MRKPIKTSKDQVQAIKAEEWRKMREVLDNAKVNSTAFWNGREWVAAFPINDPGEKDEDDFE